MRAVFLTFTGVPGRIQNAYEMWWFGGGEVLEGVLRGWFANGGGPAEVVRLNGVDDLPRALEAMPDADVVCFPGLADLGMTENARLWVDAQRQVVAACESRGSIAVLDSPPGLYPLDVRDWLSYELMSASPNAVLYYPWILAGDQWVPPCGHVAGAWARVTRDEGVMASVGGIELLDVVDVATDVTPGEQLVLHQYGVSVLRALPGWGIRTCGARTLSGEPWLFRVPTVRLLAALAPVVTRLCDTVDRTEPYSMTLAVTNAIVSLSGRPRDAVSVRSEPLEPDGWRVRIDLGEPITAGDPLSLVLEHPAGTWSVTGTEPQQDDQLPDR
ncbi:hypothetical protein [Lentzea sp. NPDC004782]|uniref:hypothetical protein n=1 Tax=Lentzea sp. NPDC004782 TaxID=3154458 RepID=UPI0033A2BD86